MLGAGFTVIVIPADVAGFPLGHEIFEVKTQLITSLLVRLLSVYVELLEPTLLPFFFHWYAGDVPPLIGVAVKVTDAFTQFVVPGLAAMLTDTAFSAFTVRVAELVLV